MTAVIIMASILAVIVVAFVAFYLHSRTPEWGDSEVRKSVLRVLVLIGPLWGMRYREPHHDIPAVTTPKGDGDPSPSTTSLQELSDGASNSTQRN
jgi:hypothetical protein